MLEQSAVESEGLFEFGHLTPLPVISAVSGHNVHEQVAASITAVLHYQKPLGPTHTQSHIVVTINYRAGIIGFPNAATTVITGTRIF